MSISAFDPIYIVGPTAVGKSAVAVEVAARIGGEIVGADAFQVYRGLDLLTAKPDREPLLRVPHHLISEIPLSETFDVARYRALALARMAEITARKRVPVVVGGTGLYVRALTHGLADLPGADPQIRAHLESQPLPDLLCQLEQLDPESAARIDRQNPRRVIRALEVCLASGRPFSSFRQQDKPEQPVRGVVLMREREELYASIDRRTLEMFARGVIEEVADVAEPSATAAQAIGFREIRALLQGTISESECIARIQQQTRNYAKRQITWFRREHHFQPLTISPGASASEIAERVSSELRLE